MTITINGNVRAYEADIVHVTAKGGTVAVENVDGFYNLDPRFAFVVTERRVTRDGRRVELKLCRLDNFGV